MKSISVYTEPTAEPVTLFEAKEHLRVDTDDENTLIGSLIKAAREWCQTYTNRTFMTTTYAMTFDTFPYSGCAIKLPYPPLVSITHVKYYDTSGTQQTWSSANYSADTSSEPGRVLPAYNVVYPAVRPAENMCEIRYVAGYSSVATVPQSIKQAILLLVAQMYEMRQPEITGTIISKVSFAVESLLNPYRIYEFV